MQDGNLPALNDYEIIINEHNQSNWKPKSNPFQVHFLERALIKKFGGLKKCINYLLRIEVNIQFNKTSILISYLL